MTTTKPTLWQRAKQLFVKNAGMQVRRFEAARIDRLASDWFATANSINQELQTDLDLLRRRARQLANNNDYAAKYKDMVENNVVGPTGVRLQARVEDGPGKPDRMANAAIESAWDDWCRAADGHGDK